MFRFHPELQYLHVGKPFPVHPSLLSRLPLPFFCAVLLFPSCIGVVLPSPPSFSVVLLHFSRFSSVLWCFLLLFFFGGGSLFLLRVFVHFLKYVLFFFFSPSGPPCPLNES